MSWTPPARPTWAERLIAHGEAVGGAAHLVCLAPDDLLEVATASTGLTDFGGESWQTHFRVLLRALEEESGLHLVGRLLARADVLRTLRNRLRLTDLWHRRPELLDADIEKPVFIVGSARTGTSILHEIMASDPASRAPAMWETQHPVEAVEGVECAESVDRVMRFWHDLQPGYETMHVNSAFHPAECAMIQLHEFLSDHWGGIHIVPSYDAHLTAADQHPAYRFHERFLKTLQARCESRRWLLKAPSHLFHLRTLFDVYPDARIIRTHRDPLKTLPSMVSLMGTLKWMRCREVDLSEAPARLAAAHAYIYRKEIEQRAAGILPDERFVDVQFRDLARDPVGTVEAVYRRLGWVFPDAVRRRVADYARSKPRGVRGIHHYSLEAVGLDPREERDRFRPYMAHYGIPEEEAE